MTIPLTNEIEKQNPWYLNKYVYQADKHWKKYIVPYYKSHKV